MKRPVGRPRLGNKKLVGVNIFFDPKEITKIQKKADKYSMTFSAYIRSIILRDLL